jgi:hypothetical protein
MCVVVASLPVAPGLVCEREMPVGVGKKAFIRRLFGGSVPKPQNHEMFFTRLTPRQETLPR